MSAKLKELQVGSLVHPELPLTSALCMPQRRPRCALASERRPVLLDIMRICSSVVHCRRALVKTNFAYLAHLSTAKRMELLIHPA